MRLGGLITLALAGTLIAAPAHAQTADRTVSIGNNAFSPAELTITQGEVVNWVWTGPDKNHSTTTSGEGQTTWDSDPLDPTPEPPEGDRFSKEFPYEGTFEYYCKTHPTTMLGRIIVVGQDRNAFPPAPDVDPPEFGTLRVSAKRRWIRFRLNENASVVGQMRGPMRRTLKLSGKLGTNVMRLPKRLKKGRYGVNLRATDAAGNESLVARVKFTLR
jgi:plastocyanin